MADGSDGLLLFLLPYLVIAALTAIPAHILLGKLGLSRWWGLLSLVPAGFGSIILLWVVALRSPALRGRPQAFVAPDGLASLKWWMAWGAGAGMLAAVAQINFAPWSGLGFAFNLASLAGGAVGGLFFASLIWLVWRWAGRRPAVKF